jgi:hypothetical protein
LSVDKSGRACRPRGRRDSAPAPGRRGRITAVGLGASRPCACAQCVRAGRSATGRSSGRPSPPCLRAEALRQSDCENAPQERFHSVLWARSFQRARAVSSLAARFPERSSPFVFGLHPVTPTPARHRNAMRCFHQSSSCSGTGHPGKERGRVGGFAGQGGRVGHCARPRPAQIPAQAPNRLQAIALTRGAGFFAEKSPR